MLPTVNDLESGEWYLAATCASCDDKLYLLHDPTDGKGTITGYVDLVCPGCGSWQELPVEHYQHGRY